MNQKKYIQNIEEAKCIYLLDTPEINTYYLLPNNKNFQPDKIKFHHDESLNLFETIYYKKNNPYHLSVENFFSIYIKCTKFNEKHNT